MRPFIDRGMDMSKYKCAVFDLDGTLMDTIHTIAYYCNEALKTLGLPAISVEKYKYLVGNGAENLIRRALGLHGISDEENFNKVYTYYNKIYNADPHYLTCIYDGIPQVLSSLKSKGFRLAVVSNKPHYPTCEIIKKYFGEELFDAVYGARDGYPKKPEPTVPLSVAAELGCKPSECIYLGDTNTDMQTGKNAGFYTVGVLWGFRTREELEENNADAIAEIPADILKLV